jgi:hypothetical protein
MRGVGLALIVLEFWGRGTSFLVDDTEEIMSLPGYFWRVLAKQNVYDARTATCSEECRANHVQLSVLALTTRLQISQGEVKD